MKITETIYSDGTLIDGRKAPPTYFIVAYTPVEKKAFAFLFTLEDGTHVWKVWRPAPSKSGKHVSFTNYSSKETAEKIAAAWNRKHNLEEGIKL